MPRQQQARRALLRLALSLLPATMIAHSTKSAGHSTSPPGLRPYLKVVPPPPMRFHAPTDPIVATLASATPTAPPVEPVPIEPLPVAEEVSAKAEAANPEQPTPPTRQPETPDTITQPSILTDQNEPTVRIEDILPFFEPPGSPRPGTLPPSSASYKQQ